MGADEHLHAKTRRLLGELAAIARTAPRRLEDRIHRAAAGMHRPYDCDAPDDVDHEVRCGACGDTWPCPEVSAIVSRMGPPGGWPTHGRSSRCTPR